MAEPVVHITNGVPDGGTGTITTLGMTLVDGANATMGATTDAASAAGAAGSLSAKLRAISRDLVNGIVLAAGNNLIGLFKLSDGSNTAAVKPASTAPVATDPALVVAISPNSLNANGAVASAQSAPVVPATDWVGTTALSKFSTGYYFAQPASTGPTAIQSAAGAIGDYISGVLIIPASTSPGAVTLTDGNGSAMTIFAGGANSVSNLVPFFVPLGAVSRNTLSSGSWKIQTGANVSAHEVGKFS